MKEITAEIKLENEEMTAEEFRTLAQEVLPHLRSVQEAVDKVLGNDGGATILIGADGYLEFNPYKTGWMLFQLSDRRPSIRYEYRESLSLEG